MHVTDLALRTREVTVLGKRKCIWDVTIWYGERASC